MKKLFLAVIIANVLFACSSTRQSAHKADYTTTMDGSTKILKGYVSRSIIENDSSFKWFSQNMKYGQPDATAVQAFKANADKFSMIVFGGTWCEDTQSLLPKFYKLVDQSGYPDSKITLVAVDRAKTTINDLHKTYNITRVPTFIVMENGKEIGRVVEYGKTGAIDKELAEIVTNAK